VFFPVFKITLQVGALQRMAGIHELLKNMDSRVWESSAEQALAKHAQ
jgi:hypothetical protein